MGEEAELPTKWFLNETYLKVAEGEQGWRPALDLAECCNAISICYHNEGRLEEVSVHSFFSQRKPLMGAAFEVARLGSRITDNISMPETCAKTERAS